MKISLKTFFNFKERTQYRLHRLWRNWQYAKFFLFKNAEFDQGYLFEFMELKLTMMGLYFAKFGIVVKEAQRKQVRTIWQARKHLQNYLNASEIVYERGQKKFIEKYGVRHEYGDMVTKPCEDGVMVQFLGWKVASPAGLTPEQEQEVNDFWHKECNSFEYEYNYSNDQLKKFWKVFYKNVRHWWD